jgi:hypothetical protein
VNAIRKPINRMPQLVRQQYHPVDRLLHSTEQVSGKPRWFRRPLWISHDLGPIAVLAEVRVRLHT